MATAAAGETAIRYEDETGAVSLTTAAELDLKRAARALPEWRRQHPGGFARPNVADARGWAWGTTHVPHDRLVDLDRLWVAAFDPVERWIVARPMRGVDLGSVRRLLTEPLGSPRELGSGAAEEPPEQGSCHSEAVRVADTVRSHACCLGVSLVGSLLQATAGGFGAVSRRLLNRSWAW